MAKKGIYNHLGNRQNLGRQPCWNRNRKRWGKIKSDPKIRPSQPRVKLYHELFTTPGVDLRILTYSFMSYYYYLYQHSDQTVHNGHVANSAQKYQQVDTVGGEKLCIFSESCQGQASPFPSPSGERVLAAEEPSSRSLLSVIGPKIISAAGGKGMHMSRLPFTHSCPYLINCSFQPFDSHAVWVCVQLARSHSIDHPSVHVRPVSVSFLPPFTASLFLSYTLTSGKSPPSHDRHRHSSIGTYCNQDS